MRKFIVFLLTISSVVVYAQGSEERVLYVVDSVAIMEDPGEEDGTLEESDIELLTVVTNKAEIVRRGYKEMDKIIFIITKEYVKRPEEVKKIPTTKQMERRNGRWYFAKSTTPYSGEFIDYFFNGKKQGAGTMKNGVLNGRRNVYFQNGHLSYYTHYINGIETGESKEYFMNGVVHQEGNFRNGKDDGLWKEWYSTGKLKRQTEFKEGVVTGATKEQEKFHKLLSGGIMKYKEGDYKGAISLYDKAIEINPDYSDCYFHRATAWLNDFKFDEAVKDYDKAIELEPMYMEAFSNRAFARLRKYEFKNSRTLSKGNGVTVLAAKDKVEIPSEELAKICTDLNKGVELGDNKPMILEAIRRYCK